jgi:putative toxin-antitoxin system antitoxin component (TIGR02293 family)
MRFPFGTINLVLTAAKWQYKKCKMAITLLSHEQVFDDALMDREIRRGLPVELFFQVRDALAIQPEMLSQIISVPIRTLMRRKQRSERLKSDESERLLRLARLHLRAVDVLQGNEKARRWLFSPNRALGGHTPFEFASTEPGAREAERLLGRIEHGVFS